MSRLEYLLSLISVGSTCRAPVESPSTAPMRMTGTDALAELSYALNGPERVPVACALLRNAPSLVSPAERSDVVVRLAENVVVYALTLRRPFPSDRLAEVAHTVARCCLVEHVEWEPCRVCNGKRRVSVLAEDGSGVHEVTCEKCKGIGTLPWTDRRRARALGLSLSTAQNRWLELYDFGISRVQQWSNEGIYALRMMALRDRRDGEKS